MFADHATAPTLFGVRPEAAVEVGAQAGSIGLHVACYAVALVLIWIGAMKFTGYEANAIQPLVANSPLMSWLYAVLSVQATSNLICVAEIAAGALIALRPWSAMACVLGSLMSDRDLHHHAHLPVLDARLGAEPRRLFPRSPWRPASSSSRMPCCSARRSGRSARPCKASPQAGSANRKSVARARRPPPEAAPPHHNRRSSKPVANTISSRPVAGLSL
jgi:Protein of unknown function, DUF417